MEDEIEIDEDSKYFFTCKLGETYQTLFIGWIRTDFVDLFTPSDDINEILPGDDVKIIYKVALELGEHRFLSFVDSPLYLLEYDNEDIYDYAGDNNQLTVYPSGEIPPNIDIEPVLDFPTFFTSAVEKHFMFRIYKGLQFNENGIWIPVDI